MVAVVLAYSLNSSNRWKQPQAGKVNLVSMQQVLDHVLLGMTFVCPGVYYTDLYFTHVHPTSCWCATPGRLLR